MQGLCPLPQCQGERGCARASDSTTGACSGPLGCEDGEGAGAAGRGGERGPCPALPQSRGRGREGSAPPRDPFGARREAQGRLQPPVGPCRDGAVLCCSSRRVGGVVPVEPVLGDLRARGQDQDAAVRGPAARRESLRGPRAAGQALQYRDLPGSVPLPPSPPAPSRPRPQPWDGRGKPRAGEPGLCSRCGGCSGARDGRYGRCGTATGTWHSPGAQGGDGTGCTLLPLWRTSSAGHSGGPGAPATGRRGQSWGVLAAGVARGHCGALGGVVGSVCARVAAPSLFLHSPGTIPAGGAVLGPEGCGSIPRAAWRGWRRAGGTRSRGAPGLRVHPPCSSCGRAVSPWHGALAVHPACPQSRCQSHGSSNSSFPACPGPHSSAGALGFGMEQLWGLPAGPMGAHLMVLGTVVL